MEPIYRWVETPPASPTPATAPVARTPLSCLNHPNRHPTALLAINEAVSRTPLLATGCDLCRPHQQNVPVRQMDVSGSNADGLIPSGLNWDQQEVAPDENAAALPNILKMNAASTVACELDGTILDPPLTAIRSIPFPLELQPRPIPQGIDLSRSGFNPKFTTDTDFMLELNIRVELASSAGDPNIQEPFREGGSKYVAVPSTEHPGYYRLLRRRTNQCQHEEPLPLLSVQVQHSFREAVLAIVGDNGQVTTNGPAVTYVEEDAETDLVPCVRVTPPEQWLVQLRARPKPSGWPSEDLVDTFGGYLHLVPIGPNADDEELWRLSFSRAEAELAHTLPVHMRRCLFGLRDRRYRMKTAETLLSSYHLKTAVFWICQERREDQRRDVVELRRAVVDWLAQKVEERHLPCFFHPEVSAWRDLTPARQRQLAEDVETLRNMLDNVDVLTGDEGAAMTVQPNHDLAWILY